MLRHLFRSILASGLMIAAVEAQTFNWGNAVFDTVVDSSGNPLGPASFTFELGAFAEGFDPAASSYWEWMSNWQAFDIANYNPLTSQFGSTVYMELDGTSPLDPGGASFLGRQAYLWVRNGNIPWEGTEWLLVTTDEWTFPATADDPCCPKRPPYEWFVSDLGTGDTPLWGSQSDENGPGVQTDTGIYTLQTHTFVPEPGVLGLLIIAIGCAGRRRTAAR